MKPADTLVLPTAKEALLTRIGAAIVVLTYGPEKSPMSDLRNLMAPATRYERDECLDVAASLLATTALTLLCKGDPVQFARAVMTMIDTLPPQVIERLSAQIEESRYHAEGLV